MELLRRAIGFRLYRVQISEELPIEMPDLPPEYETRVVGLPDILAWCDKPGYFTRDFLEEAFAAGHIATCNFYRGGLVGYSFNALDRARVTPQIDAIIGPQYRYAYAAWTHPDHRRKHLGEARRFVRRQCAPRPASLRGIAYIETDNFPSLANATRNGRHPVRVGYCGHVTWRGKDYPFTGRVAKRFGFRLVRRETSV